MYFVCFKKIVLRLFMVLTKAGNENWIKVPTQKWNETKNFSDYPKIGRKHNRESILWQPNGWMEKIVQASSTCIKMNTY